MTDAPTNTTQWAELLASWDKVNPKAGLVPQTSVEQFLTRLRELVTLSLHGDLDDEAEAMIYKLQRYSKSRSWFIVEYDDGRKVVFGEDEKDRAEAEAETYDGMVYEVKGVLK